MERETEKERERERERERESVRGDSFERKTNERHRGERGWKKTTNRLV